MYSNTMFQFLAPDMNLALLKQETTVHAYCLEISLSRTSAKYTNNITSFSGQITIYQVLDTANCINSLLILIPPKIAMKRCRY